MKISDCVYIILEPRDWDGQTLDCDSQNIFTNRKEMVDELYRYPWPEKIYLKEGLIPEPWLQILMISPRYDMMMIVPTKIILINEPHPEFVIVPDWVNMRPAPPFDHDETLI